MPRRVASWWRAAEEKRRARSHPSTPAPRRLCCTRGHPRGRGSGRAPCRPSPRRPRGERGAVLGSWSRGQLLSHHQHHHRTSKLWWSIAGGLRDGSASDRGKEADLDPGPATEDPPSPSSTLSRSARSPSLAPRGVKHSRLLASHASKEVWETFPEILCPKNPGFDHRFRPPRELLKKTRNNRCLPEFAVFVHSEARSSEWRTRCEKQSLKPQGAGVEDTEWRTAVLERSSFWVTLAHDSRSFVVPAERQGGPARPSGARKGKWTGFLTS